MTSVKKVTDELKSSDPQDVVELIKKHYFKKKKVIPSKALTNWQFEHHEFLKPTLVNLFGLEMRFRAIEEMHRKRMVGKQFVTVYTFFRSFKTFQQWWHG